MGYQRTSTGAEPLEGGAGHDVANGAEGLGAVTHRVSRADILGDFRMHLEGFPRKTNCTCLSRPIRLHRLPQSLG